MTRPPGIQAADTNIYSLRADNIAPPPQSEHAVGTALIEKLRTRLVLHIDTPMVLYISVESGMYIGASNLFSLVEKTFPADPTTVSLFSLVLRVCQLFPGVFGSLSPGGSLDGRVHTTLNQP